MAIMVVMVAIAVNDTALLAAKNASKLDNRQEQDDRQMNASITALPSYIGQQEQRA
jgi:hypothetical protein